MYRTTPANEFSMNEFGSRYAAGTTLFDKKSARKAYEVVIYHQPIK